jgi:hypothetical protein
MLAQVLADGPLVRGRLGVSRRKVGVRVAMRKFWDGGSY